MNPKTELLWNYVKLANLDARVIFHGDRPYLARFYFNDEREKTDGNPGMYLHYFFKDDPDRGLHNHPWEHANSYILAGGYRETYRTLRDPKEKVRIAKEGDFLTIGSDHFHRVELLEPGCWSLFTGGPRTRSWGFLDGDQVIDFKDYLAADHLNPERQYNANDPELAYLVQSSRQMWLREHGHSVVAMTEVGVTSPQDAAGADHECG